MNKNKTLIVTFFISAILFLSCGLGKKLNLTNENKGEYQPPAEVNINLPHTVFTVKIEGTKGLPVNGYITPMGKQVLERYDIKGEVPLEYKSVEANKIFLKVIKPGVGGFIRVTLLDKDKVLFCDSTNVDKKYVQMIAYPGNSGFGNMPQIENEEIQTNQLTNTSGYIRVTCEKPMIASVQITKDYYQNSVVCSWEGKTPFIMPVGFCKYFSVEAYNDQNVMWDFTCEILDADKKVLRSMKCDSHELGINMGSAIGIEK